MVATAGRGIAGMSQPSRQALDLEQERIVDRVCEEFEAELRRGELPAIEEYLPRVPASAIDEFARELTALIRYYAVVSPEGPGLGGPELGASDKGSTAVPPDDDATQPLVNTEQRPAAVCDPDDFVLLELVGRGGMGTVHRAL